MSAGKGISRRGAIGGALAGAALFSAPAIGAVKGRPDPRTLKYRGFIDRGVSVFRGIRYARAKRFDKPTREPLPSSEFVATEFGPLCPQRNPMTPEMSEDCLFLNIWSPDPRPEARRPVMVYFHGGAYNWGSVTDPLTQGLHLAAKGDVVVVSVNHRINVFGYGWLYPFGEKFRHSGNAGQLDLICALEWIREHISAFGGDANRVMVFGQSGGGAKIATLMAMPEASGLFHSAATMSGQQVIGQGPANALKRTRAFMRELGLGDSDVATLTTLPYDRLVEGLAATDPVIGGGIYFGPVLDMIHLHRHPFWPDAAPQSLNIPMILGNTRDETRAFIRADGPVVHGLDWSNIAERLAPQIKIDLRSDWVVSQYRAKFPDWSAEKVFYAATTAGRSWPGQVIEADRRAEAGAKATWVYQLDRESPLDPKRGAAHTDDLPYVFGTLAAPGSYSGTDKRAHEISDAMIAAFAGLARNGVPGLKDWTPYSLPDRDTLVIGQDRIMVQSDPRQWERELWATGQYIQPGG